jgi:hypothetical protein
MSRQDFAPDLSAALDRFGVPAPPEGFADRIMGVTAPVSRPAQRDRRGGWKLARRVVIGTLAAGMVSAAAVASGLLGAAGIRVPVLTAMLAPKPDPAPIARVKAKPTVRTAMVPKPPVTMTQSVDPGLIDPGSIAPPVVMRPQLGAGMARRVERRAERRAFIRQNPELVPVIKEAMSRENAFVQANPDVRELRRLPPTERRAFLAERPELQDALRARQAERRAFRAANPQADAIIRARIQQRRAALRLAPVDPALEGNSDPVR